MKGVALNDKDIQASLALLKLMGLPHTRSDAMLRSMASTKWINVRNKAMAKKLTIQDLRVHFDKPIAEAAFNFGICTTLLKKICRKVGVKRWPCRQIRSLTKTIGSLEVSLSKVHNREDRLRIEQQIEEFKQKQRDIINDPGESGRLGHMIRRKPISIKKSKKKHVETGASSPGSCDNLASSPGMQSSVASPVETLVASPGAEEAFASTTLLHTPVDGEPEKEPEDTSDIDSDDEPLIKACVSSPVEEPEEKLPAGADAGAPALSPVPKMSNISMQSLLCE